VNFLRFIGLLLCIFVVLNVWGCLPESSVDVDYETSDEYKMQQIENKMNMLENNQNW